MFEVPGFQGLFVRGFRGALVRGLVTVIAGGSLVACGGGNTATTTTSQPAAAPAASSPSSSAPVAAPAAAVSAADAATVTGKVTFSGTAPKPTPIKLSADPYCQKADPGLTTETEIVGPGGEVENVFVYVKDGLGNRTFPAPTEPVTLDQKGCHYAPHVLGIMVGQPLKIVNSDNTLHNVHGLAKENKEFNQGQPIQGMQMTHVFSAKEVMIPFKCDVHNWMNAWIGVLDHPFYAVTGADGTFTIKGLPPGTYTIEAWHEKLGSQTQTVTVGAKESKTVAFTYKT
jgi:plastocyanin